MRRTNIHRTLIWIAALLTCAACTPARPTFEGPERWETAIQHFERTAQRTELPQDAVLFIGSSSIARWSTLKEDMAPIPVIQRGFGGSLISDNAHYAERLVQAPRPRAIVLFAGTNDIRPQATRKPQHVLEFYEQFVTRVRNTHKDIPIYFIAITPSPLRWQVWNVAREANERVRRFSEREANLRYIDFSSRLLGADGAPDPAFYVEDRLHMSPRGYEIWTDVVRSRLLADFPELKDISR